MIKPFRFDDLFKINSGANISVENDCLIIDNFFLNYDMVLDYVYNNNVEIWKHTPNGKNFTDYYDCRHAIQTWWDDTSTFDRQIIKVIKYYYHMDVLQSKKIFEFNYFKHLKMGVSNDYQHHPHVDVDFNLLVYLDEQSNGGTAIYNTEKHIENNEADNLLYDVSGLDKTIIQAKPNRCVIFNGNQYHGGHIDNHDVYYDNWRINLVRFYERILPRS